MPSCDLPSSLQALPRLPCTRPVSGFVFEEPVSALKPTVSTDTAEHPKYVKKVFIARKELRSFLVLPHSPALPVADSHHLLSPDVPFWTFHASRTRQRAAFLAGLSSRSATSSRFICVVPGARAF